MLQLVVPIEQYQIVIEPLKILNSLKHPRFNNQCLSWEQTAAANVLDLAITLVVVRCKASHVASTQTHTTLYHNRYSPRH